MPRFNGTGPQGLGPATGWGGGHCGAGMAYGRRGAGTGRGFGGRRFWGYCPMPALSKKEESDMLTSEIEATEEDLKALQQRLADLKGKK